jgi:2',3'-cyclic-nucleotide 2'-phosphodiesterase (5'-nucleotidase family)
LLVDAGDILDEFPDEEITRHTFEVYRELGYDAIAFGDRELTNGLDRLLEYRQEYPLICHNLSLLVDKNRWVPFSQELPCLIQDSSGQD